MPKSEQAAVAQTPILESGVLPFQARQDPAVMTILGAIGFSIVILVPHLLSGSSNTDPFLLVYAALFFAVVIHELGHLTAGWYLGFRFRCIAIWRFAISLEHGRLKLRFLRELIASGYAGMDVDTVVRLRRRLLFFIAAGPAANLITVPIAVLFAHTFLATRPLLLSFANQLAMISILSAVLNLLPLPVTHGLFSDGSRIAMLVRDRERTRRLLSIYAVGAQQRNGKRPESWKQTWLRVASSVCDDSTDDFLGNLLAYTSCIARNDGQSGAIHLERCLQVTGSLTDRARDLAAQQAAYFSATFRHDTQLALKWMEQVGCRNSRKIRFAESPRKVRVPLSARQFRVWSEET
jgi:Zn-dependent protease